jgi:hypothetical protein
VPGGPPGPGRPAGSLEHRTACLEALDPSDVRRILQTLRDLALEGDVNAARLVLDRVLGKAREAAPNLSLDLPDLRNTEQVAEAVRMVVRAVAAGHLPGTDGKVIVDLLAACIEVGEVSDLLENAEIPEPWRRG